MGNLHPQSEYYLHTNGTVHYKPHGGVSPDLPSPFVVEVWDANVIGKTPYSYMEWLKQLEKLGAQSRELRRLVDAQNLEEFIPGAKKQLGVDDGDS